MLITSTCTRSSRVLSEKISIRKYVSWMGSQVVYDNSLENYQTYLMGFVGSNPTPSEIWKCGRVVEGVNLENQ